MEIFFWLHRLLVRSVSLLGFVKQFSEIRLSLASTPTASVEN